MSLLCHSIGKEKIFPDVSENIELNYIETALRKTQGKVQPAVKLLGITHSKLIRQMTKKGINAD
jgi:DNA-binding NtrC family response regulator